MTLQASDQVASKDGIPNMRIRQGLLRVAAPLFFVLAVHFVALSDASLVSAARSAGERVTNLLAERVAGSRFFEALVVADARGGVLHRAGPAPLPRNAETPWAFRAEAPALWAVGNGGTRGDGKQTSKQQ